MKALHLKMLFACSWCITYVKFISNGVHFSKDFVARGIPRINVNMKGTMRIGKQFVFHSGEYANVIGRQQPCYFIVGANATLEIGDHVGLSGTAIVCWEKIVIGDFVKMGGGVVIYDTDFHSLNPEERNTVPEDLRGVQTAPVEIAAGAFIGAHSIILKGVRIGKNAIVGAGSVVSKSIPDGEIWAGNPAKFIRTV